MFGFFTAPRYVFGPSALEQLSALPTQRPAVVVAPSLAADRRLRRVVEELAKREVPVATVRAPDGRATPEAAERLATELAGGSPDWIVAVGGGSVQDLARAAWLRYERPDLRLEELSPLVELALRRKAGFVAVPTTSGAGAEASPMLRLWASEGSVLRPLSRELVPDWVLLDPGWPPTVPAAAAADAAAEALGNAVEGLVSAWSNPLSEALARESTGQLVRLLPKFAKARDDPELAASVHHAAALAGLAAGNSYVGAASALAEALAPPLGLAYGRCLGIVLPAIVEFNYPSARDAYQGLGPRLGDGASIAHRSDLPARLRATLEALGIPSSLERAGIGEAAWRAAAAEAVPRAARNGAALANPRVPSQPEWERLVEAVGRGTPVGF
jgi:alcohol dehydrogenase class IV